MTCRLRILFNRLIFIFLDKKISITILYFAKCTCRNLVNLGKELKIFFLKKKKSQRNVFMILRNVCIYFGKNPWSHLLCLFYAYKEFTRHLKFRVRGSYNFPILCTHFLWYTCTYMHCKIAYQLFDFLFEAFFFVRLLLSVPFKNILLIIRATTIASKGLQILPYARCS